MLLRAFKSYLRRRQLTRRGIVPQLSLLTFSAGARSGVWTVCPEYLAPGCVVYSVGVGDNLAWDYTMIEHFGATVHAFDPTPASVRWVRQQRLPQRFFFHPIGLAAHDGMAHFTLPTRGSRFNYHPVEASAGDECLEAPVARLGTLMGQLGHARLDVLKMDIEGGEYAVIDDLLATGVSIRQLLVEFHHHFPEIGLARTEQTVQALAAAGYRIAHISERGLEITFVNERG